MSTLKADTIVASDGSSPVTLTKQAAFKMWMNYKGTSTNEVRDSLNVSSVTDNTTGDYTSNFSSSMSDTNYAISAETVRESGESDARDTSVQLDQSRPHSTSAFAVVTMYNGSTANDRSKVYVHTVGDLA